MNRNLFILIAGITTTNMVFAYDLPTIAVPNLVTTKTIQTPVTTTTTNSSSIGTTTSSVTTNTVLTKEVQSELPMFNADIKGALINSKKFRVVDLPNSNNLWNGDSQTVLNYVNNSGSKPTASQPVKAPESGNQAVINQPDSGFPDYILLGKVSSITQDADMEPLQNTNKITSQYNIDISVDYQVVGTKDHSIIAAFNAYGHANDVKILNANDKVQKQNHNMPQLINQASKDLAENVVAQLQQQFSVSQKTYNLESVTNLKIYN